MDKKVLIAMSGGVDSSVAAFLLKQQGFDCTGAMLKLCDGGDTDCDTDAQTVSQRLDIPFYTYDYSTDFDKQVIGRFIEAYQNGETPNPCIYCNRYMKFTKLLHCAKKLGIGKIATGHYAGVEYDEVSGKHLLKKAYDDTKDQSYVLYTLTQEQLKHVLFPLAKLTKAEIREIAAKQGFINADKPDSQDICFVKDGDYAGFIEKYTGQSYAGGDFTDNQGNVLGRHKGLIRYTIGQRKGLGVALKKPMYVRSKNTARNTIVLGTEDELYTDTLEADDFNWIACEKPETAVRVKAKVRYKQQEQWASAAQISDDIVEVRFDRPQRAIAKGQAVVLYDGDIVVGGGTIR